MAQRHVAVVGGGVMGSFAAYWLKVLGGNGVRVTLVERDQLFCTTSAVLSAGGFRQQFSLKENILLSLASVDFLKNKLHTLNVDPDDEPPSIGLAEHGYVFMAGTEEGKQTLQRNNKLQRSLGADIKLLTAEEMKQTMPYLEVDDIKLGARGTQNEGYFDPYLLLQLVRRKVQSQGTTCISADTIGINMSPDKKTIESIAVIGNDGEQEIRCDAVVNAAGAWSGRLAKMAGIDLPVEPRPRTIYAVDCKEMGQYFQESKRCPLTVDPSGVYFRGDVGSPTRFLCGKSPLAEEDTELAGTCVNEIRAQLDSYPCQNFFETNVWPVLAARAPHFETLKVQSSWSGCYDYNTWDQNGIVGPHPEVSNMFFCTGFSGHGLQMSPASGRAVAETVLEGKFVEIDLENFKYDRFLKGEKVLERNIV